MRLTLRDYQEDAVAAVFSWFGEHDDGNPIVVAPTGSGKSLMISEFVRRSLDAWPSTRFLVLTHVKELISQNYEAFAGQWGDPLCPAGIYSAGLGRRDARERVVFAGVQSIWKRAADLGSFDIVIIDEVHLVPPRGQGRYLTYLEALREINPAARAVGFTATPFRLDGGYLHKGKGRIFSDIAYEIGIERLVEAGHLVPLVALAPEHQIDVSNVRTERGEFKLSDLADAAMGNGCVDAAINEAVAFARDRGRRSWLVFGTNVAHAEEIVDALRARDVSTVSVFGDTPSVQRDNATRRFRDGEVTAIVNVGVLTTGFDAPRCDCLIVMRPTQSAALYVQMMGRGMRPHTDKRDCLVLDYGGNVARHGPVNLVRPRGGGDDPPGPPPTKVCPSCRAIVLLGTTTCEQCGHEWPAGEMQIEHAIIASRLAPYDPDAGRPRMMRVDAVFYRRHQKTGRPDSLRADYVCGMRTFSDWVCVEHGGYAGRKAARWWSNYGGRTPVPETVEEALKRVDELIEPAAVEVVRDNGFDRVSRRFGEKLEEGASVEGGEMPMR